MIVALVVVLSLCFIAPIMFPNLTRSLFPKPYWSEERGYGHAGTILYVVYLGGILVLGVLIGLYFASQ